MVSSQDDREEVLPDCALDQPRDSLAGVLDLREEARLLVADCGRLGHRRLDVAQIDVLVAEIGDPSGQARVPNRRRTHVNTPSA